MPCRCSCGSASSVRSRASGPCARIRSRLLRDGQLADLLALARRAEEFTVDARVTRAAWAKGRLGLEFRATLSRGPEARPLTFVERDGAFFLDPLVADDLVGPVDVSDELDAIRAQVSLVDRGTALEWIVPGGAGLSIRPAGDPDDEVRLPALVGFVELDAQRVGPGEQPLDDGAWDVQIRWSGLGLQSTGLLRLPRRVRNARAAGHPAGARGPARALGRAHGRRGRRPADPGRRRRARPGADR